MLKLDRPSPTESELLFEIDPEPAREVLTAMGGAPLLVQAFRSLGLAGSVREHVHVKQRQRGYDEATFVESFGLLKGLGGGCLDGFERLREGGGMGGLGGHAVSSPAGGRAVLFWFDD